MKLIVLEQFCPFKVDLYFWSKICPVKLIFLEQIDPDQMNSAETVWSL